MIYMDLKGGKKLLIVDPGNIKRLQEGRVMVTPDDAVGVAYTPDIRWLAAEIESAVRADVMTTDLLHDLIRDSQKREPVLDMPRYGTQRIVENGELVPKAS